MSNSMQAPWIASQARQILAQRGHAWLLQGPSGLGQYQLALALVRAWMCENPGEQGACGQCPSCHAMGVRTHADVCVLMPETVMLELAWPLGEKAQSEIDDKKRKPSREIRIEALRDAIEFAQRTSARGRGKAVLVFPAERMNNVTANALLKTLEEPPGDVRFVLASEAAHQLLPTIRSRCLLHTMDWPDRAACLQWLQDQGVSSGDASTLLRAAGGRPDDALLFAASGRDPKSWRSLPKAMARCDVSLIKDWSPTQLIDALHKLCHDLIVLGAGGSPRFFEPADLPPARSLQVLTDWGRALARSGRSSEHPFNTGLMLEALVNQAQTALNSGR
jgi:DNA polymerase III subunit delta'